eukprot:137585_1
MCHISKHNYLHINTVIPNIPNTRYTHIVTLCSFRPSQYEPDCGENFDRTKCFAFYAAKIYSIALAFLGVLQPPFLKPFPTFLNYNINRDIEIYSIVQRYFST